MSRTIVTVFAALFALLMPVLQSAEGVSSLLKLTEADNGKTVQLHPGQKLDVALDENPTTGYQWEVVSLDKTVLKQSARPGFKRDSNLVGAGGKKTFHFKVAASGRADLKLIYHRSWEKNVPPIRTFEVTVEVR